MKRVMIADDELLVRMGLKNGIPWQDLGCQVVGEAADGEEALSLYAELKPDLVFLDIGMPRADGLSFFEKAAALPHRAHFVILSSHNDFGLVRRAMQLGAIDYIHKLTFTEDDIARIVSRLPAAPPQAAPASAAVQEMCPPLDAGAAQRGEPPYAGAGAAAAIFVEGGDGSLAERERFARDALGQVFRGICSVSASLEGGGCVLLLGGLPEWMGAAKLEEMADRVENTLQTCLNGTFAATCAGLAGSAAGAISGARRISAMNRYARAALRHVHRHHARQLSLHSMAAMLNLNESYFASLFKRETGDSFIAYLNRYRVKRAQELLQAGRSVKSAACAVGFESVSYFDRVYKHFAGETPSAFLDAARRGAGLPR